MLRVKRMHTACIVTLVISFTLSLTLWRCLTKMMEGGQNRRDFSFVFCRTRAQSPDLPHAKWSPPAASYDSQLQLLLRAVNVFGWLCHQKLNEHAPTDRITCGIMLDLVALADTWACKVCTLEQPPFSTYNSIDTKTISCLASITTYNQHRLQH